jgi:serine protease inhibitor ecotin
MRIASVALFACLLAWCSWATQRIHQLERLAVLEAKNTQGIEKQVATLESANLEMLRFLNEMIHAGEGER